MVMTSRCQMDIIINGKPAKVYFHEGNHFIEGREGSEFQISVRNNMHEKMKAIVSVDGLSIVDGNEAGLNSDGYIVDRYQNQIFEGWRTSNTTVNKFFFSSKKKSYNKRVGQNSKNIGVIGLMTFTPKIQPVYRTPMTAWYGSAAEQWPTAIPKGPITICNAQASNIGTGFGEKVYSQVVNDYTEFNSNPDEILCIYYDDRAGLEKRGIVVDEYKSMPNAFPSYLTRDRYVKRPIK